MAGPDQAPRMAKARRRGRESVARGMVISSARCSTGQEVIARLDTYDKVQKYLMIIELSEELRQELPLEVYIDDENIGHLTSYVFNPATKRSVGLGYLKKMYTTENDIYVELQTGERRIPGRSHIPPQGYDI